MKVKHFIYASACVMGLAACNNEEIALNDNALFDGKGELVELKDGFVLSVDKNGLNESRALSKDREFQWMPVNAGSASEIVEEIGLCWTGVNNLNPTAAPAATTGSMVYTNYKFSHVGWLFTGETEPEYDVCDGKITNGEYNLASGLTPAATWDGTNSTYVATTASKTLNLKQGIFNTENSAIYSGEYIVYYPYSDEFFDSPIVASAPKLVEIDPAATNKYEVMAKNSFSVGYAYNFAGGQESENFATNMLSAGAYIGLQQTAGTPVVLKQVVLLAAGENDAFITKQELSAQAIKNANNVAANIGTGLYLGTPKATSKTLVANMTGGSYTLTVNATPTAATRGYVVLPVLPTSISDLKILLVNNDNETAIIDCGAVNFESVAKGTYSLSKLIDLKDITFKKEYIATDATSLNSIITTLDGLTGADQPTAAAPISVRTIGEIAFDNDHVTPSFLAIGSQTYFKYIRFYGDKLIVPENVYLSVSGGVTIENDIDIMHKGCCCDYTGWIHLYEAKLTGTINNYGGITLGNALPAGTYVKTVLAGATLNNLKGVDNIQGNEVEYEGIINVYKQATLSLTGDAALNNAGTLTTEGTGNTNEDGTVTVEQGSTGTIANSGMIVNGGNINPSNGLSNTTAEAVFVDKVGSQLTGYGLDNTVGGEYICEVNDQTRYNTAITSAIRPTTLVRFVDCPTGGGYEIAPGDVNNSKGNMVSFEVKGTSVGFEFKTTDDSNTTTIEENLLVSTVKNFYLTEGTSTIFNKKFEVEEKLNINTDLTVNMDLTVGSEMNVNKGTTSISNAVGVNALNSACKLTVTANQSVVFNNYGKSYFNNIVNNGSIDIKVASGTTGVAHELWTKTYTTGSTGIWANNSYPMQY